MEDAKKASENALQSPPPAANTTPDYAAGLNATPAYAPATPAPAIPSTSKYIFFDFIKYFISSIKN